MLTVSIGLLSLAGWTNQLKLEWGPASECCLLGLVFLAVWTGLGYWCPSLSAWCPHNLCPTVSVLRELLFLVLPSLLCFFWNVFFFSNYPLDSPIFSCSPTQFSFFTLSTPYKINFISALSELLKFCPKQYNRKD